MQPIPLPALLISAVLLVLLGLSIVLARAARRSLREAHLANARLRAEIETRRATEEALRRAKTEADAASRAKSEFLASVSHEIRTPMNGVLGMASLLLETRLTSEQRDYVQTLRNSGDALLAILNDVLDFSKVESGKLELERLPFELSVCVEDALDFFTTQAAAKEVELAYHIDDAVPAWVLGDATRLRQVIANLVNNAVKFTPSGSISVLIRRVDTPDISATAAPEDGAAFRLAPVLEDAAAPPPVASTGAVVLEVTVADTGIGIPSDRLHRLFQPFTQVDSSTTRKYGGTGLGLAICHRIVTLLGGRIAVESTPGAGSTFRFTLPTAPVQTPMGWGLPPLPQALAQGEVLCVEDNAVVQQRIKGLLDAWGAQAVLVTNPQAALARLETHPRPAVIVLDVGLFDSPAGAHLRETVRGEATPLLLLVVTGQSRPHLEFFAGRRAVATAVKPLRTHGLVRGLQSLADAPVDSLPPFVVSSDARVLANELPLSILLVEDNLVNQKVALRYLERLGYRADVVATGADALKQVTAGAYQLVLMDLQMPGMDGLETTRQIRLTVPADRQPKIVALTANAMNGDREQCLAAGMDDYITKPVKLVDIAHTIRRHFSLGSSASHARADGS